MNIHGQVFGCGHRLSGSRGSYLVVELMDIW